MPTTRKQKSRADKLSDFENMKTMLCSNHFETEKSELSNSVRRPEILIYHTLTNHDSNSHSKSTEIEIRGFAGNSHILRKLIPYVKPIHCSGN